MTKLSDVARAERNRYQREWHKKHPGKQKEYMARMWERKARQKAKERGLDYGKEEDKPEESIR